MDVLSGEAFAITFDLVTEDQVLQLLDSVAPQRRQARSEVLSLELPLVSLQHPAVLLILHFWRDVLSMK
jgi:hypothetical protein